MYYVYKVVLVVGLYCFGFHTFLKMTELFKEIQFLFFKIRTSFGFCWNKAERCFQNLQKNISCY